MLIAFLDMVVLDSLIIFLTRVNVILLYEKPKEPTKSCTFKPSSFSVYGTDEMYIENVKVRKLYNYISSIKHQNFH